MRIEFSATASTPTHATSSLAGQIGRLKSIRARTAQTKANKDCVAFQGSGRRFAARRDQDAARATIKETCKCEALHRRRRRMGPRSAYQGAPRDEEGAPERLIRTPPMSETLATSVPSYFDGATLEPWLVAGFIACVFAALVWRALSASRVGVGRHDDTAPLELTEDMRVAEDERPRRTA